MSHPSTTSPTRSPASALGLLKPLSWGKYLPLVLGLLVFSACDSNDDDDDEAETPFGLFDTDDDGVVSSDEFGTSFNQLGDFGNFDADASGDLDQDEFNAGVLSVYDADDSGDISESEFNAGNAFFGANQTFGDFDADASGALDADEFNAAAGDAGSFANFDVDFGGAVDADEFNEGVFGAFDSDLSGDLDEDEFNAGSEFFDVNAFGAGAS